MKILVVGAAGGMASGTIKDLLSSRSRHVESIVAADVDQSRLEALRGELADERLHTKALDVRDRSELLQAIAAADLCINAVPTFAGHQMTIFEACLAARRTYVDYGGMGAFTVKQKKQHAAFQAAGVTAVLGLGSDPGTSNVVCKAVADRLDRIDRINLFWAAKKFGPPSPILVPPYNINTVMAEYANPSMQFLGGRLAEVPPQSGHETLNLPEPFGSTEFMYTQHSEPLTVPFSRGFAEKGIQEFTWKLHLPAREHEGWAALVKAGFGEFDDPIDVNGTTVIPGDVLAAVLRRNAARHMRDVPETQSFDITFAIGTGERAGARATTACAVLGAPDALYDGYLDAATSMGLSIGVQLLADAPAAPGVWAPEEVYDPEEFFRELERRHFRVVREFAVERCTDVASGNSRSGSVVS